MARGEGADAEARAAAGGLGPRRLLVGAALVLALVVAAYLLFARGGATYAEATSVQVDLPGEQVQVAFSPPEGCWAVTDDSSVEVVFDEVLVDLRLESDGACASTHAFPLPAGAAELPDDVPVRQVACEAEAVACVDDVRAEVIGASDG